MPSIRRSVFISFLFLGVILGLLTALFPHAKSIFLANTFLNGIISSIFLLGIFYNVFLFFSLRRESIWFLSFDKLSHDFETGIQPKILKPLLQLFQQQRPTSFMLQATLGSIQNRFEESREINRYITGLLIFLGLLGTFWGLSHTVTSISTVVSGIDLQTGDIQGAFRTLKEGLRAPLAGMGTAFSSSLFGLLGSLIISFIDVQYSRAIQGFFYYIEEKVHFGKFNVRNVEIQAGGQTYSQSVFEQAAESMQLLTQKLHRTEESRQQYMRSLNEFAEKLKMLVDQQDQQLEALQNAVQSQFNMQQLLARQTEVSAETTKYWRSLDTQLSKIQDELILGRQQLSRELCEEIRTVSRILSALGEIGRDAA